MFANPSLLPRLVALLACKWLHHSTQKVRQFQMEHSVPTRCLSKGRNCLKSRCNLAAYTFRLLHTHFDFFQTSLQALLHQEKVLQAQLRRLQGGNSHAFLRNSIDSASSTTTLEAGLGLSVPEPFRASLIPSLPPSKWCAPVTPPASVNGAVGDNVYHSRSPPPPRSAAASSLGAPPTLPQYRFGSETLSTVVLPSPLSAASTTSQQSRSVRCFSCS